jgi:hypothetical protein
MPGDLKSYTYTATHYQATSIVQSLALSLSPLRLTVDRISLPPLAGVNTVSNLPASVMIWSVALYCIVHTHQATTHFYQQQHRCCYTWSACAWRPTTIGFVHPGTNFGTFLHKIGARNTVPPSMLRIVPFGLFHIFFKPNSIQNNISPWMHIPQHVALQPYQSATKCCNAHPLRGPRRE